MLESVLALLPAAPAPRPHGVDAVSTPWLGPLLARGVPGARLRGLTEAGGDRGTTDRRRLALSWNDAGLEAHLPTHVFLKGTATSAKNRTMVAALDMARNEVRFFTTARADLDDEAPGCFFARAGHGARFLLVLEDLVSAGCRPWSLHEECPPDHAWAMMTTLAALHAMFWESPRFATDLAWARRQTERAGYPLLRALFRRSRRKILTAEEWPMPPRARRLARIALEHDRALEPRWEAGPLTLLHGDSHFGNSYSLPDGRAGLLDWQVAFRGPGIREVAYFATGGLPTETRRAIERDLVQRYLDELRARGIHAQPFDAAWDQYRFFVLEGFDAAVTTALWPGLQTEENVRRSFQRAMAAVEDLEVDDVVERAARP